MCLKLAKQAFLTGTSNWTMNVDAFLFFTHYEIEQIMMWGKTLNHFWKKMIMSEIETAKTQLESWQFVILNFWLILLT